MAHHGQESLLEHMGPELTLRFREEEREGDVLSLYALSALAGVSGQRNSHADGCSDPDTRPTTPSSPRSSHGSLSLSSGPESTGSSDELSIAFTDDAELGALNRLTEPETPDEPSRPRYSSLGQQSRAARASTERDRLTGSSQSPTTESNCASQDLAAHGAGERLEDIRASMPAHSESNEDTSSVVCVAPSVFDSDLMQSKCRCMHEMHRYPEGFTHTTMHTDHMFPEDCERLELNNDLPRDLSDSWRDVGSHFPGAQAGDNVFSGFADADLESLTLPVRYPMLIGGVGGNVLGAPPWNRAYTLAGTSRYEQAVAQYGPFRDTNVNSECSSDEDAYSAVWDINVASECFSNEDGYSPIWDTTRNVDLECFSDGDSDELRSLPSSDTTRSDFDSVWDDAPASVGAGPGISSANNESDYIRWLLISTALRHLDLDLHRRAVNNLQTGEGTDYVLQPQGGGHSENSGNSSSQPLGRSSAHSRGHKRGRGDHDEEDDDDQDRPPVQRARTSKRNTANREVILACPFAKWKPREYHACNAKRITRVRDVRQHLRRSHRLPIYCERCKKIFPEEKNLIRHAQEMVACELRTDKSYEGVTRFQEDQLRKRLPKGSTWDKWYHIFEILFPNHKPKPDNPYMDSGFSWQLGLVEKFMTESGPEIMLQALQVRDLSIDARTYVESDEHLSRLRDRALHEAFSIIARRCRTFLQDATAETKNIGGVSCQRSTLSTVGAPNTSTSPTSQPSREQIQVGQDLTCIEIEQGSPTHRADESTIADLAHLRPSDAVTGQPATLEPASALDEDGFQIACGEADGLFSSLPLYDPLDLNSFESWIANYQDMPIWQPPRT
jgi:hypothetical protein